MLKIGHRFPIGLADFARLDSVPGPSSASPFAIFSDAMLSYWFRTARQNLLVRPVPKASHRPTRRAMGA